MLLYFLCILPSKLVFIHTFATYLWNIAYILNIPWFISYSLVFSLLKSIIYLLFRIKFILISILLGLISLNSFSSSLYFELVRIGCSLYLYQKKISVHLLILSFQLTLIIFKSYAYFQC